MLLITGLAKTLVEPGKKGIDICKVWTKSRTVSGIKICRDVGFKDCRTDGKPAKMVDISGQNGTEQKH